jgi:hypothetical protein
VAGHPEREALFDPDVLALARAELCAVVTNNIRDFRPGLPADGTTAAPATAPGTVPLE